MARWRLTEDHYLAAYRLRKGPTQWEYEETDRLTGEVDRMRYDVPLYCDKETIVCRKGSETPQDNIFIGQDGRPRGPGPIIYDGPPTPAMEPLDDEAKAINEEHRAKWGEHPIETLQGNGFTQHLLSGLEKQLADLSAKLPQTPSVVSGDTVSKAEFEALKAQLATLLAREAEGEAQRGLRRA